MAGSSLFALLDDITALLDDIAVMSKVAAKKTAGVLGDDLALNAKQVEGISASRELPVVWAVSKGSLRNKAILVPLAMLLSVVAPWAILPLLMIGGAYLCFEGAEKIIHVLLHKGTEEHSELLNPNVDLMAYEKEKIKGAIRTDFILSAEIIVITLSVVSQKSFLFQLGVLTLMSILMTIFVYGLVAAIIKMDDVGFWLKKKAGSVYQRLGDMFILSAPKLMKVLSILGTAAMFLVGGEFLVHGWPWLHHLITDTAGTLPMKGLVEAAFNGIVGLIAGCMIVGVIEAWHAVKGKKA